MEKYLDITMEYAHTSRGFLPHLRRVIDCCRRYYRLEGYQLARMGLKRIDGMVRCRIVFRIPH